MKATVQSPFLQRQYMLDHVVIDANGLITWEIVGSYVIDVNGSV
jgi:hypothetical protein